jgi:hypothetical protein
VARRRPADEREVVLGLPRLEVVLLVDEHPDLLVAPLHLRLGLDEACHQAPPPAARRIARSIFG